MNGLPISLNAQSEQIANNESAGEEMTKEQKIIKWLIVIILTVVATTIIFIYNTEMVVSEQESQIEILKESNASLQQERDDVYDDYAILRDQLWNLNNSLEKETNQ